MCNRKYTFTVEGPKMSRKETYLEAIMICVKIRYREFGEYLER